MAADQTVGESEHLKSLIISTAQELWEDQDALGKFLGVVRRSEGFAKLADSLEQSDVRPTRRSSGCVVPNSRADDRLRPAIHEAAGCRSRHIGT